MGASVRLTCVGTGDAFGSGGRLNSCYYLQAGTETLLLDCGCSSLIGLQRCGIEPAAIDAVIISHLHGDHFGGIPFLLLEAKYASRRQRPLVLIGPLKLQQQVETAAEALYSGAIGTEHDFPVVYRSLDETKSLSQGSFLISCAQVIHGSSADAYAIRVEVAGKTLCYTGDTEWTDNLIPLAEGSDLLLAECYAYKQPVPSHLDYQTLQQKQPLLACRRLLLTHLGPEMLEMQSKLQLESVNDGDVFTL